MRDAGRVALRTDARKPAPMIGIGTRTARFGARSRVYGYGDKMKGVVGCPGGALPFL